jgi:hypothetical protein
MPVETTIRARVETFASELIALIRSSAVEVVEEALGGKATRGGGGRGRARSAPRASGRRPKGAKRDPKLLESLTEKLGAFIKKNPGLRIEQIGKALGAATKDLALPVKKLIAAKRVSTKGQRRATTYYAGKGGRGAAKPAGKGGRRAAKPAKGKRRTKKARVKRGKKQARPKTRQRAAKKRATKTPTVKPAAPAAESGATAS